MRWFWLLLLAACASHARPVTLHATLAAPEGVEPPAVGIIRAIHGRTACRPRGGVNAYIHWGTQIPRAGVPLEILFVTRHGGNAPSEDCWLIWSTRPFDNPTDFSPFGMPGCWLLVRLDNVLAVPTTPGGMVQRQAGEVLFRWDSPIAGTALYMQLLVAAPGQTPAGFLASHGVEILVGG